MLYWTTFSHRDGWEFVIAASSKGLCFTGSEGQNEQEFFNWVRKHRPDEVWEHNSQKLKHYLNMFEQYFNGEIQQVNMPLDVLGTPFQLKVWEALLKIPFGVTISYSDVANMIDNPKAVRAVGRAIGANPVMIAIPCHRIIGKNGTLTGFRGGLSLKQKLLHFEEIGK